ncbi:hypothetical protein [Pedobacter alluvionis]|uniref:Lipid A deacylase LpxR family protein n=1 Tax=Pedobacter alluvionis TaxID=475253 RepID=A0A497XXP2_9SPHI|nr:hypothetical protein [Pedobacter alluvionis]RLJ73679.1 hypothetical protein BCL90_3841 [Pedobacter alluvionis]TFB32698.1 hypothetical protein E3V97_01280 [Pedobacter alluvionis]
MKTKSLLTIMAIMLCCYLCRAQNVPVDSVLIYRLLKDISIRNTFDEDVSKVTPAQFMFTIPRSGEKSYLVDGGIAYTLGYLKNYTAKAIVEYHKNTMIEKEQDNFSVGYSGLYYTTIHPINVMLTHNLTFVDDGRKSDRSIVFVGNLSPYSTKRKIRFNAPGNFGDSRFGYLLTPNIGTEIQQVLKSLLPEREGTIFRGTADFSGAISFLQKNPDPINTIAPRILQLSFSYTLRRAFSDNTSVGERKTELLKAGADFFILDKTTKQVSLGLAFKKGSNPLKGLDSQQYWQFSVNVQL